jgi:hypothetical protein
LLSLPDLLSPPISPTISRQTQTYAQTAHFAESGFSFRGLATDIDGPRRYPVAYEFPLYQAGVGALFVAFGPRFLWGKAVSLVAATVGLWLALQLFRELWDERIARRAGFFLATCPLTLALSTAFQPDALALAFEAGAMLALLRWSRESSTTKWLVFLMLFTSAALAKFTVLVPLVPVIGAVVLRRDGRWRKPMPAEIVCGLVMFVVPFLAWNLYRPSLMYPNSQAGLTGMFFIGDLTRFLRPSFYVKPAFILGAMGMCGAGVLWAAWGLQGLDPVGQALLVGALFYYVLIPTAADQTYYGLPVMPFFSLLMARGTRRIASSWAYHWQLAIAICWLAGFGVAAPYALRHDNVSLAAAQAVGKASRRGDLLFVMNMHDRGVGIGGFNPTIVTLAERRGWNVQFDSVDAETLRVQIEEHRRDGLRWIVATWFTPDLDPWFAAFLPASFSRCPRFNSQPVDGRAIARHMAEYYPVVVQGSNFAVLEVNKQ